MKVQIIIIGTKPKHLFAKKGMEEYLKRLTKYVSASLLPLKDGKPEDVATRILQASEGSYRVVLDERGEIPSTSAFAKKISAWTDNPQIKKVSFIIGASDGHTEIIRKKADYLLGLSKLTLMHEIALVVLLEQIYRAFTIRNGEPYHR